MEHVATAEGATVTKWLLLVQHSAGSHFVYTDVTCCSTTIRLPVSATSTKPGEAAVRLEVGEGWVGGVKVFGKGGGMADGEAARGNRS